MWVPCHYGMARPQVADGGDALQFWRASANILNKQSRTSDKESLTLRDEHRLMVFENRVLTRIDVLLFLH
jgi:hypothetical protein